MTLKELETIRDGIQKQLEHIATTAPAPGQDTMKSVNLIELRTAVRTVEQLISQERASLAKPRGSLGPVLAGV